MNNKFYFKDTKFEVDNCLKLSIFNLNQIGALNHPNPFTLVGDYGLYYASFEAQLSVIYSEVAIAINFQYNSLDEFVDYVVQVTPSECNLGGQRYWLLCPMQKESGEICHKRVGVLYKPPYNNYFGCRDCHNLTYKSSKPNTFERRFGRQISIIELEELRRKIKRPFYKGDATKSFKRYFKQIKKLKDRHNSWCKYFDKRSA